MEEMKQAFLKRFNEVKGAYDRLFTRQAEIRKEMGKLHKQMREETGGITAETLLAAGKGGDSSYKSKLNDLSDEMRWTNETIDSLSGKGGYSALLKTDKEFEELARPLLAAVEKDLKEDVKKRQALESKYEKVIEEVLKLEEERREYQLHTEKKLNLLSMISANTNIPVKHHNFQKEYRLARNNIYHQLGKIKGMK